MSAIPMDPNAVTGFMKGTLGELLGIRFVETSADRVVAELTYRGELTTIGGALHGGTLMAFDQRPYTNGDPGTISMAKEGFIFVPKSCQLAGCRIHVAFHGCRQNAAEVGERFAREAGYNRWADANRLIVLYPQTIARYWLLWNPRGCWDWWGYTDQNYATKTGPQLAAVWRMIERLAE